jgi:hypothetical protein
MLMKEKALRTFNQNSCNVLKRVYPILFLSISQGKSINKAGLADKKLLSIPLLYPICEDNTSYSFVLPIGDYGPPLLFQIFSSCIGLTVFELIANIAKELLSILFPS